MDKRSIKIQTPLPDDALRVGDFALLPVINKPPVITSHPLRNFHQLTWTYPILVDGKVRAKVQSVRPFVDTFTVRKGTALTWGIYCTDPSNVNNLNDISNLTFVWKRDGQPLYEFNRQNEGRGVQFIEYTEEQCTEEIDGTYTCEVSNEVGTTTSTPFTLQILDLDNNDQLYINLLLNGDADGGLDGWQNGDGQIRSINTYYNKTWNPSSITTYDSTLEIGTGSNFRPSLPYAFRSQIQEGLLFYGSYDVWSKLAGEDLTNLDLSNAEISDLPGWIKFANTAQRNDIIPNEDFGKGDGFQGFYPGIKFLDSYNRNSTKNIRLQDEVFNRPLNYFGRQNITFNADPSTEFTQTIDITELSSLTQGQVGGVEYLTAQFFSYIGCAISRYTIKTIQNQEEVEYNYYIHDLDKLRGFLSGDSLPRITPDQGSTIEIIPHTDDTTVIYLDMLNELGDVIETKTFQGPTALDVWAIKEKTDWILTLYPIFQFFNNRNNPIKVFGQTYTNTQALAPLFNFSTNGKGNLNIDNIQQIANQVTDINAKFILKRYGDLYNDWRKPYPTKTWEKNEQNDFGNYIAQNVNRQEKAYPDKGAAAFFAVGGDVNIPTQTTQIRVRVEFTNNSPARVDSNPQNKAWRDQEIYNTLFDLSGTPETAPKAYYKYGTPRCGITKMKLILVPNRDIASSNHTTYSIPPSRFTTLGIAKQAALSSGNDSSQKTQFTYTLYKPDGIPTPPNPTLLTQFSEDSREELRQAVELGSNVDSRLINGSEVDRLQELQDRREFANNSIDIEEADRETDNNPNNPPDSELQDGQPPSP